jgi:ribosomal protein S27E
MKANPIKIGETYSHWLILALAGRTKGGAQKYRVKCPTCDNESVKTVGHMDRSESCRKCATKRGGLNSIFAKRPT